jgi:hypothetical protein
MTQKYFFISNPEKKQVFISKVKTDGKISHVT